ncbi:LuxR C-terminal-related transcriptional regulator [Phenylobacterium sp.]|uniref:LuxR C-terminal-related transcriptional regulator n=1 Tax=Phenylobacterium sp. TaxID=1871053 RepID=UPI0037C6AFDB
MSKDAQRGRPRHSDVLTPAEWRVVEAVRHGMSNPMIARRQGVSVDAVKFHVSNVLNKLGLARRAELRRWAGIQNGSAAAQGGKIVSETLKLGPLGQIARSVKDIGAAQQWYGEVLGLPHLYTFGKLAFYDLGGVRLFLEEGEAHPSESVLYFRVPDIHAGHATLSAKGVAFTTAPHMIHKHDDGLEEWMAFFEDNEGRVLAIMAQMKA